MGCWEQMECVHLCPRTAYRSGWRRAGEDFHMGLDVWDAVWTGRLHYWSACPVLSSPSIQVPWRQHSSKKNDSNQWKWLNGPTQLTHYELPWHGGFIFRWIMEHCLTYWPLVGVLILPQDRHCVRPELMFMNYTPSESVNLCFCSPPLLQKTPFAW